MVKSGRGRMRAGARLPPYKPLSDKDLRGPEVHKSSVKLPLNPFVHRPTVLSAGGSPFAGTFAAKSGEGGPVFRFDFLNSLY